MKICFHNSNLTISIRLYMADMADYYNPGKMVLLVAIFGALPRAFAKYSILVSNPLAKNKHCSGVRSRSILGNARTGLRPV